MSTEIKVPTLPESVPDAVIATWHVKPGEAIKRDQNLVDLETDKVVIEVPAPDDGVLESIALEAGATVLAGDVLGVFTAGATGTAPAPEKTQPSAPVQAQINMEETPEKAAPETKSVPASLSTSHESAPHLSPAMRRLAAEKGLTPEQLANNMSKAGLSNQSSAAGKREEKRVPMSRLRARIAERLLESQQSTASLTTFNEINLQAVMDLRKNYKEVFEKKHDTRLGFMSFFTKAAVEALKRFPLVNASIDGNDVIYHGYYDIGMAVSTERGLVVPVLRNAETLSMAEIEKNVATFAKKARDNQLSIDEITGGTFTITNGGVFGSLLSTPILNPPQSAILGLHKIQERAVVENGQVVVRPMMYVALTYDHRIIDGKESVQFLVAIKELLEDPSRLLLSV